jgi:acyl-CoA thioesterase
MMRADRFAATSGMRLVEVGEGRAVTRMKVRPEHLNGAGVVQGGAIFTLADLAFAAACNSHGTVALALDVSITFARAASKGTLTAEAREVALSRKVSVVNVEVRDGEGELVAAFRGTAYRKEQAVASLPLPAERGRRRGRFSLSPAERERRRPRPSLSPAERERGSG